jgi:hypothetical protein
MHLFIGENKGTGWCTQESERADIEGGIGEEVKTQMGIKIHKEGHKFSE